MSAPVLPEDPTTRQSWLSTNRMATLTAIVSAVFAVVLGGMMLVNLMHWRALDPLVVKVPGEPANFTAELARDKRELLELQTRYEKLFDDPKVTDVAIAAVEEELLAERQAYREAELAATRDYFQRQERLQVGAWFLVGALVVLVVALEVARRSRPVEPRPLGEQPADRLPRERRIAHAAVAVLALLLLGGAAAAGIFGPGAPPRPVAPAGVAPAEIVEADSPPAVVPDEPLTPLHWPMFRKGDGTAIASGFTAADAKQLWVIDFPLPGYSSPIIAGDHVFLTGGIYGERFIVALSLDDGSEFWRHAATDVPDSISEDLSLFADESHSAETPATDGERVYALFANGDIIACDARTGERVWARSLGLPEDMWGHSSSLVMAESLLIVPYEHENLDTSGIFGLDPATGEQVWKHEGTGLAYTTPVVATIGDRTQMICSGWGLVSLDPATGEELWSNTEGDLVQGGDALGASPAIAGDLMALAAAGNPVLAFRVSADGAEKLWEVESYDTSDYASPVTDGELLWCVSNDGYFGCFELETGTKVYEGQELDESFYAALTLCADAVVAATRDGSVFLLDRGREFKQLSSFDV
ncbi:MAG: PQQ-binding-like beta-propeller repeat protein, partial [Planctomycetota bacterium]